MQRDIRASSCECWKHANTEVCIHMVILYGYLLHCLVLGSEVHISFSSEIYLWTGSHYRSIDPYPRLNQALPFYKAPMINSVL